MALKKFPSGVLIPLLIIALFLSGCATPKRVEPPPSAIPERARWESSLSVRDIKANRGQSLTIAVLGERAGRLRLEASAIMGVPVASMVLSGDEFRCAIYQRKTFYQGPATEDVLQQLFKVPLSPNLLHQVMFEIAPQGTDWSCRQTPQKVLEECQSERAQTRVRWQRKGDERVIRIDGPGYEATWAVSKPRTEVQFRDGTFRLEAPAGYRLIQL